MGPCYFGVDIVISEDEVLGGKGSGCPGGNPATYFQAPEGQEPKNKKLSVWVTESMKTACDERGKDWVRAAIATALEAEKVD